MTGKVVVNRAMSLDGFVAGPVIVLTHRPPPGPSDGQHSFVSGAITAAVAWAKDAAVTAMRFRVVETCAG